MVLSLCMLSSSCTVAWWWHARGRTGLPDNKHSQKSELCVIVNMVTHLIVKPTVKHDIKLSSFTAVKVRNPSQALALAVSPCHGLFFFTCSFAVGHNKLRCARCALVVLSFTACSSHSLYVKYCVQTKSDCDHTLEHSSKANCCLCDNRVLTLQ
jgi:hypothetical protein